MVCFLWFPTCEMSNPQLPRTFWLVQKGGRHVHLRCCDGLEDLDGLEEDLLGLEGE